ncbi:MAG TPA: helix-turn-helix transcriptional regulator [Albidovulum sp.]|uniref:helix-turn-helix domain-containing protein n=1 Tax=Albidovulum sp. TaxID=1872424 RepID=UPI002CC1AC2C|nr:helix-turn-helix transcriptional regulator [Albidovulum sp.]
MTKNNHSPDAEKHGHWYSDEVATLGDRLTDARIATGMSQKELAERLGVRARTVRQWEEDAKEPRANRLQMLAGMLNVSLMWLLTGEGLGLPSPEDRPAQSGEAEALMGDLREMRKTVGALTEQMGRVEARLRQALSREAA